MRSIPIIVALYKDTCRFTLAVSVVIASFSLPASADERQYKVEAAYLYSFFNYITWPGYDSPQKLHEPVICVSGNDPLVPYLDYIRNKMEKERTLRIRAIDDEKAVQGCHIFFVRHRSPSSMLNARTNDTLMVFKPDDPLDRGGMIELSEDGERITIKIDQSQLERNGFQISSRLLDLAQRVN